MSGINSERLHSGTGTDGEWLSGEVLIGSEQDPFNRPAHVLANSVGVSVGDLVDGVGVVGVADAPEDQQG